MWRVRREQRQRQQQQSFATRGGSRRRDGDEFKLCWRTKCCADAAGKRENCAKPREHRAIATLASALSLSFRIDEHLEGNKVHLYGAAGFLFEKGFPIYV